MMARAISLVFYIVWNPYARKVVGVAVLGATAALIGTSTSVLVRNRSRGRTFVLENGLPTLALFLFCLSDWVLLWVLPRLRISFSYDIILPLMASWLVRMLVFCGLTGVGMLARWRARRRRESVRLRSAIWVLLAVNLAFSAVQVDAYVVEPLWVETTGLSLQFADLDSDASPVRVVQLSDIHISRHSFREEAIVEQVNALQPDIIVLTGDYLNLSRLTDPVSADHFRQLVNRLQARYGIYAVRGSVEPWQERMAELIEGTEIRWLEQEAVTVNVRGQPVTLIGVACSHDRVVDRVRLDEAMRDVPGDAFTLLLYHSPDLVREAAAWDIDLYLGGHTHGGQLRLPFYGAIVTSSEYGKRYERGLFYEQGMAMYISRGLGL